jgi:hypothetical protein
MTLGNEPRKSIGATFNSHSRKEIARVLRVGCTVKGRWQVIWIRRFARPSCSLLLVRYCLTSSHVGILHLTLPGQA